MLIAAMRRRATMNPTTAIGLPLAREYLDGRHPQQAEVHLRALSFDYLWRWAELMLDWAEKAEREVSGWDAVAPAEDRHRRALAGCASWSAPQ
jgi:hypothetical protein